jgi:glycosyltransferase involved in cell wall biosynthesis
MKAYAVSIFMTAPLFSLIVCTIHRVDTLDRLFTSLTKQTCKDFEVILVDQNTDDRLAPVIAQYRDKVKIIHLTCAPGLSRARNVGLKQAGGRIVSFPDDDCWYPDKLLRDVAVFFTQRPWYSILSVRPVDENNRNSVGRFARVSQMITRNNIWNTVTSISLFIQRPVIDTVGGFNERLGVGAGTALGGGEDIDYPLRAMQRGFKGFYSALVTVHHPQVIAAYTQDSVRRGFTYGTGVGWLLRTYKYPWKTRLPHLMRPFGGTLLSLSQCRLSKARYHWAVLCGRIYGMMLR